MGKLYNLSLNSKMAVMHCFYWKLISLIIFGIFLLTGCGTSKTVKQARQAVKDAYEVQKPIQVRTSKDDDRPEWTHKTSYEDDGNLYFTGGFFNGSDYSVTVRCANAEALKVAIQSISQFIRAEFTQYVHGSNVGAGGVDRYVEDGIATFVDSLHMQGVRQKEVYYYEEIFSPSVMQPTFNVFVMLEMGKADYLHCKAEVLRRLRNKFSKVGEKEAKEKAERLLEELKQEVRRYGA
jgi:hypothetical protein